MNHEPANPTPSPNPDFDARLRHALHEVDVPADLARRILSRVAASPESPDAAKSPGTPELGTLGAGTLGAGTLPTGTLGELKAADTVADSPFAKSSAGQSGATARRWQGGPRTAARWAGVGCVVASLVLAAYFAWRPQAPGSVEELVVRVGDWRSRLPSTWEASSDSRPSDHPLDARVKAAAPRWQRLATSYDAHAVVYELRRGVGRALLFVVRCPTDFLNDSRRLHRLPTTGVQAVGAWRRGPWLYLLSVDETNQRLEDYFSPVPPTVARWSPAKSPDSSQLVARF